MTTGVFERPSLEGPEPGVVGWPPELATEYRARGVWTDETLWSLLERLAAEHGQRTAVVDATCRLSYADLHARSRALAGPLHAWGVGAGDAVIVQLPNCAGFVELLFALARLGARPVMAQPGHRQHELGHFARTTAATAHVIASGSGRAEGLALSRELRAHCPHLRHTLLWHLDSAELERDGAGPPAQTPALPGPPADPEAVALFQLSGGSTAVPKLIPRTHADYLYSVRQSVAVCRFSPESVYLAALPVAHNFPLSSPGALGVLAAGGTLVLARTAAPEEAFDCIERESVTATALVPALLPPWLRAARRSRDRLASLQLLQVGGARLHEELARRVEPELGCQLQQVFGMAEGLVCYTRLDDPRELVCRSQGKPMSPLDEVRIVDDSDREVPPGQVGHLLTRGPYTIRGYYAAPEHNAQAFTDDGFYRTGDLARRLPDGSLVVEGRAKDQINRAGEKISAPEVESLLLQHPRVEQAAVVGVEDRFLGERSRAFIGGHAPPSARELVTHLQHLGLAGYKIPDDFELLPELPRTPVGKVDKAALRGRSAPVATTNAAPSAPREDRP